MTISILSASAAPQWAAPQTEYTGTFTNDATALVSTTVSSGGALNAVTADVASITGLANRDAISIATGGDSGGTVPLEVILNGAPSGSTITFAGKIKKTAGLSAGAAVQRMLKLPTPFMPRHVRLLNVTDGVTWEWFDGLGNSKAIKTVWSTGVTTLEQYGGPLVVTDGLWMPQTLLGTSKTFSFVIRA